MGIIYKPYSFATGAPLAHDRFNDNFQRMYDELDGNIDDTNIKDAAGIVGTKFLDASIPGSKILGHAIAETNMDYTSVEVVRAGPNTSNQGRRVAVGSLPWSMANPATTATYFVIFAVDSDWGNPRFNAAPRIVLGLDIIVDTYGTTQVSPKLGTVYATGFFVTIIAGAAPVGTASGELNWQAIGVV